MHGNVSGKMKSVGEKGVRPKDPLGSSYISGLFEMLKKKKKKKIK
jgi:hypothetical protein